MLYLCTLSDVPVLQRGTICFQIVRLGSQRARVTQCSIKCLGAKGVIPRDSFSWLTVWVRDGGTGCECILCHGVVAIHDDTHTPTEYLGTKVEGQFRVVCVGFLSATYDVCAPWPKRTQNPFNNISRGTNRSVYCVNKGGEFRIQLDCVVLDFSGCAYPLVLELDNGLVAKASTRALCK